MTPPKPANDNQPRLLSRAAAAAYCGFKPSAFSAHVLAGHLPQPIPNLRKWDKKVLDEHLDKLSGLSVSGVTTVSEDPWADWKKENARKA